MAEALEKQEATLPELTPKQAHFAKLICQGYTGVDAYRTAYEVSPETKPQTCYVQAAELRRDPKIAVRIKEGLDQARLQDLDSIGRHIQRTLDARERAELNGSDNVEAKLLDQLGKMHGAFRDTRVLVVENHMSDAELLDRLARGNPDRLEAAKKLLDTPSGFEMIDVTPDVSD